MNTINDKLNFYYNGRSSKEFNLLNIHLSGGLFEETFVKGNNIDVIYNNTYNFANVRSKIKEPIEFDLTLGFTKKTENNFLNEVANWLYDVDYFTKIEFEGTTNKIMYCMPSGESKFTHDGCGNGYLTVHMITNSPYVFGERFSESYSIVEDGEISIYNEGIQKPDMRIVITPMNSGSVTIIKDDYRFILPKLTIDNKITIEPNIEDITDVHTDEVIWSDTIYDMTKLQLNKGYNNYIIEGECEVLFEYIPTFLT